MDTGGGVPASCIMTRISTLRSKMHDGKTTARNNAGHGKAKKSAVGDITPESDKSGNNRYVLLLSNALPNWMDRH